MTSNYLLDTLTWYSMVDNKLDYYFSHPVVVSWSLLTVHITPTIALQLMQGLYNGQQRDL